MFLSMNSKKELRTFAREQRSNLSESQRAEMSLLIADQYMQLFELDKPKVVHLFLPIVHLLEVNTMIILERLNTRYPEVKTVTSIIAEDGVNLLTVEVRFDSDFSVNSMDIPEPVRKVFCNEKEIEEVLTPLLATDMQGCRLGYGKGFYDRFFDKCLPNVVKTGINYFSPIETLIPKDSWDKPLSRLVNSKKVFFFTEMQFQ
jgi:5-formyltetrahydrofolate cyclo-ligase